MFLELNWRQAHNTGFHFTTELAYSALNLASYSSNASIKLYPYQIDNITDIFNGTRN